MEESRGPLMVVMGLRQRVDGLGMETRLNHINTKNNGMHGIPNYLYPKCSDKVEQNDGKGKKIIKTLTKQPTLIPQTFL